MANRFTRFLTGVGSGLVNPKGVMGDWRHASRLFVDNTYRLSPRTKFLFYVRFEIRKEVLSSTTFNVRHSDEVGYLIKSTDLPKFKFDTVTKNQYNRKKIVYKNFQYEPISMVFRDDSAGIMNAMWALYMSTYVQDRLNPVAAFTKTNLASSGDPRINFRYGLDKEGRNLDFFESITIYTMSRRRFLGYKLINPKIINWQHGGVDYSASETNEYSMNVEYESIVYQAGNVGRDSPKGFATLYYDNTPSPLTVAGGGVANLFGDGGVLDGLESVFGAVADGTAFGSVGGFIGTAIQAVNTARNASRLSGRSIGQEVIGALATNPAGIVNRVGGLVNTAFPRNSISDQTTPATQRRIVPGDQG